MQLVKVRSPNPNLSVSKIRTFAGYVLTMGKIDKKFDYHAGPAHSSKKTSIHPKLRINKCPKNVQG
jgi:hypothetical protein